MTVVGAGYVGLVSAACLAQLGHQVVGVDIDADRVEQLQQGVCPIHEPGLPELLADGRRSGRLRFDGDLAQAASHGEFVLLCLPTPPRPDGAADTSIVDDAVHNLRGHLAPQAIVITKSTVPVGTGDRLVALFGRDDIEVASNPEFLREGAAVNDFLEPDRIVIGATTQRVTDEIASLYERIDAPMVATDRRTAELIKYASNAFLGTKLSFMNSIAELCESVDGDIDAVMHGLGTDPRIGAAFLQPGPGFGGSCFPKDMQELVHLASQQGQPLEVVRSAISANERQFDRIVDQVADALGGDLVGRQVGQLGLAYKAGTDDVRQSPAVQVATRLIERGAYVDAHDPHAAAPAELLAAPSFRQAATVDEALAGAEAIVVVTEWPMYRSLTPTQLADLTSARIIVDGRRLWSPAALSAAGFDTWSVGSARRPLP